MRSIPFVKMHGAGNDFIMIDGRKLSAGPLSVAQIEKMCRRRLGVGADGLIVVQPASEPDLDFRMTYFNADGTEAELCGNGARCAVALAQQVGLFKEKGKFASAAGLHAGVVHGRGDIEVSLPGWRTLQLDLDLKDSPWPRHHSCNTGVPHLIIPVDDVQEVDVAGWGQRLLNHARFQPSQTNVNWVAPGDAEADFLLRTFERGVEAETLACGTGASAAAVVLCSLSLATSPVKFRTRSGELLTIGVDLEALGLSLRGPAQVSFHGEVNPDE